MVSHTIHLVFGMKLHIASAVLLTHINSGFVSVISLETAKNKAMLFVPDERKKKTDHMQVTYLLAPGKSVSFKARSSPRGRENHVYYMPAKCLSWGHNCNCISGSRGASLHRYLPVLHKSHSQPSKAKGFEQAGATCRGPKHRSRIKLLHYSFTKLC